MSENSLVVKKEDAFPEINTLQMTKSFQELCVIMPEHEKMLATIQEALPEVQRTTSLFMKTQSQFMDNMMTVSAYTPIRNVRQILAEMNQVREAIKEAHFKLKKKEIERRMKQRELEAEKDDLKAELIQVEIMEIMSQADTTRGYISGAIRKLANYTEQYNAVVAKYNLQEFNEADFERQEEEYHIKKAFEQGMCAARARGGLIDEGNMIYFTQIGINGATAQFYMNQYLQTEQKLLSEGKAPTHKAFRDFLEDMVKIFAGSSKDLAEAKGMTTVSENALLQTGDNRLLLKHQS